MGSMAAITGAQRGQLPNLYRCPYCKGQGVIYVTKGGYYFIECDNCHSQTAFAISVFEARSNWNYENVTWNRDYNKEKIKMT